MANTSQFSHLVVIGSSAGGIEALSTLVATLPADFPAPIVIAQHLDPNRPSSLEQILARRSTLPVRKVPEHGHLPLEPGVVFVVPSNCHVQISDSAIDLRSDGAGRSKPSVDLLLSSAAGTFGDRLIAVILTGTGSDGAAGARAVKKAAGTVIIQDPATASFPAMPLSLAPNTVDIVAKLERIGPMLGDLLVGATVPTQPDDRRALEAFLEEVRARYGIDFTTYKTPTILRRLQRRIVATGVADLERYIGYLDTHPEEWQQLINAFLIKVTEFFRDPDLFAHLREEVLPELIARARRRGNELRLWSAGCATGEEAYSLAILVSEALGAEPDQFSVRIFATDLDTGAVAFARRGVYSAAALAGLPEDLVVRYFTRDDDNYQIKKRVRGLVVFGRHDLGQRSPFPNIDMALCRNVLIYFTPTLQSRTLKIFAYSLRDGGFLVLGKAETASPLAEFFVPAHQGHKIYRRQGERILVPPPRPTEPLPAAPPHLALIPRTPSGLDLPRPRQDPQRVRNSGEGVLLRLPVGVVTVDRRYDIGTINGAARRFLSIHSPAIGEDLIHVAQGVPHVQLRAAIDTAFRDGTPVVLEEVGVEEVTTGEPRFLQITCYPQRAEGERGSVETVIVVVNDTTPAVEGRRALEEELRLARAALQESQRGAAAEASRRGGLLERLVETNRHLLEANQELTSANEELLTTSEESLLTTEEAQAATEEVETLNEELQATNEELETLNEELQATIEELNTTNEDLHARSVELQELARLAEQERAGMEAILASMGDAVLVVDSAGLPVLTNAAYQQLFGDDGGPVLRDGEDRPLPREATPQARAARGESFRLEFSLIGEDQTRRRFEANGQPARDGEGHQFWGVVVIRDVTERKLTEELLQERENGLRLAVEQMPTIVWSTDTELRFVTVVGRGLAELNLPPNLAVGLSLSECSGTADPDGTVVAAHRRALAGESVSYESAFKGRTFQAYVEPLRDGNGTITGTIGVAHDVTERSLRRLQDEFLALASHELRTPLTPIQSYLQMLLKLFQDRPEDARARRYAETALTQVQRLSRLVGDLVDVTRLQSGKFSLDVAPMRLNDLVEQTVEVAQTLATGQTIALETDGIPLLVRGDAGRIEQVLLNLLSNAITHAPDGQRIDVRLRRAGAEAEIQVQDYGAGIAAADLPNLFSRFYQVVRDRQPSGPGLGLGLFIAKEIVTSHGGAIEATSVEGQGATFTVRLPLLAAAEEARDA